MSIIGQGIGTGRGAVGGAGTSSAAGSSRAPNRGGRSTPASAGSGAASPRCTSNVVRPTSTRSPQPTGRARSTGRPPTRVPCADPSSLTTTPPESRTRACTRDTSASVSRTVADAPRPTVNASDSMSTSRPASGPATTRTRARTGWRPPGRSSQDAGTRRDRHHGTGAQGRLRERQGRPATGCRRWSARAGRPCRHRGVRRAPGPGRPPGRRDVRRPRRRQDADRSRGSAGG